MADRSSEARYLPLLAGLLLLILGGTAWLLYDLNAASARPKQAVMLPGVDILVHATAASLQVHRAIAGDQNAYAELAATAAALDEFQSEDIASLQRSALANIRSEVAKVLAGKDDVLALQAAVAQLNKWVPAFVDSIYELQGELSIQRQPAVIAQLERLRLLGNSMPVLAQGFFMGGPDLNRQITDNEMELQQIVRALQTGDPALGVVPLTEAATEQAIVGLADRASQIGEGVRNASQSADRLQTVRTASQTLDALVLKFDVSSAGGDQSVAGADVEAEWLRIYALLGGAMFIVLVMLALWMRNSGQSSKAKHLAMQSESDQQAILQLLDELGNLADGDLTVQATVTEDVTGAIADSINYAIEALRDLVATVNKGAILVEDASRETQASAQSLEAASDAQSRQVKAATEAVHNMAASIDEISGNAERSSDVARHSVDIAHKGGEAVRRTIEGMNTIRETIQDTAKRIKRLGESSQEIGDIVELINDIADQTNILALNASIQASMAGEAGRGFAVVADEVQRLAERSANATKQIEVLVSTIQSDTNEAVVSMERSTTDVVGGALLAENAGAALEEIESVSNQIAMLVQNISGSSREQTEAAKTVLKIVERLNQISGETDASAATTADFVGKLFELASQLREAVSGFVLPEEKNDAQIAEESASDWGDGEKNEPSEGEDDFASQTSKLFADQNTA
jgi:twitching motility protein PilJ